MVVGVKYENRCRERRSCGSGRREWSGGGSECWTRRVRWGDRREWRGVVVSVGRGVVVGVGRGSGCWAWHSCGSGVGRAVAARTRVGRVVAVGLVVGNGVGVDKGTSAGRGVVEDGGGINEGAGVGDWMGLEIIAGVWVGDTAGVGDAAVQADSAIAIEVKATQECGLIGKPATARASSLVSMAVIEVCTVCMGCHFRLFRRSGRLMKAGFCGLGYGPRVVAAGWGLGKKLA